MIASASNYFLSMNPFTHLKHFGLKKVIPWVCLRKLISLCALPEALIVVMGVKANCKVILIEHPMLCSDSSNFVEGSDYLWLILFIKVICRLLLIIYLGLFVWVQKSFVGSLLQNCILSDHQEEESRILKLEGKCRSVLLLQPFSTRLSDVAADDSSPLSPCGSDIFLFNPFSSSSSSPFHTIDGMGFPLHSFILALNLYVRLPLLPPTLPIIPSSAYCQILICNLMLWFIGNGLEVFAALCTPCYLPRGIFFCTFLKIHRYDLPCIWAGDSKWPPKNVSLNPLFTSKYRFYNTLSITGLPDLCGQIHYVEDFEKVDFWRRFTQAVCSEKEAEARINVRGRGTVNIAWSGSFELRSFKYWSLNDTRVSH